ncbi:hypothetical protein BD309DRAFT_865911 [Dichomitus squalens]|uniref:Uncharacterized protein n=2 Tax=Dichomitus squalens TaxID=114155 RepID=A0A4Q9NRM5_9APHY|nr:uncharacterized protein DICSQDRAFT_173326 [Dichomitus squalens LYAD-421 SS1]EJF58098.1 hypothetical protein DICSQDRAFT_173326 [Dichomitus squalens LYAD-421 SS1]TBU42652.1 hypothetical protein BD309DRAFT_865911 [Dichomitus squalens]TBU56769.1 hypothetical protein BD310DRAFT_949874 [Dichomitus squalens]
MNLPMLQPGTVWWNGQANGQNASPDDYVRPAVPNASVASTGLITASLDLHVPDFSTLRISDDSPDAIAFDVDFPFEDFKLVVDHMHESSLASERDFAVRFDPENAA